MQYFQEHSIYLEAVLFGTAGALKLFGTHLGAAESWRLALRKPSAPSLSASSQQVRGSIFPSVSSVRVKALLPLI